MLDQAELHLLSGKRPVSMVALLESQVGAAVQAATPAERLRGLASAFRTHGYAIESDTPEVFSAFSEVFEMAVLQVPRA